jgi:hypothetical protein
VTISVLTSYADRRHFRPLPPGGHLMLDSGAYSALTRGEVVETGGLTAWYRQVPAERYAALDVIYDPERSRANALAQRALGVEVMPAVHAGTDPGEVDRLADDGFTAIALGGLGRWLPRGDRLGWMRTCLDRAEARGLAVHGFAFSPLTPRLLPLLMRFSSVDSSSWTSQYGLVYVWDGSRVRALSSNADRLEVKRLTRRWPIDTQPWLARTGIHDAGQTRIRHRLSAASFLLFGDWLIARGGPRIYLAGYHGTGTCKTAEADAELAGLVGALTPAAA